LITSDRTCSEHGDKDDAEPGTEVAAVDRGDENRRHGAETRPAVGMRVHLCARRDDALDAVLEGEQRTCGEQQERHGRDDRQERTDHAQPQRGEARAQPQRFGQRHNAYFVIASGAKQSRAHCATLWIASLRSQ